MSYRSIFKKPSLYIVIVILLFSNMVTAQTPPPLESVWATALNNEMNNPDDAKKEKKKKNSFTVFAGINVNGISGTSDKYTNVGSVGWLLGFSYRQGKFFYWQVGAIYNSPGYNIENSTIASDTVAKGSFGVREIGVPITGGINFLSFVSRIVGLRLYISAMPAYAIGVGDNDLGITTDNINQFNVYGQVGLGVDIAFVVIEAGYNYGFMDMFKNDIPSKPGQLYVTLGFRF